MIRKHRGTPSEVVRVQEDLAPEQPLHRWLYSTLEVTERKWAVDLGSLHVLTDFETVLLDLVDMGDHHRTWLNEKHVFAWSMRFASSFGPE